MGRRDDGAGGGRLVRGRRHRRLGGAALFAPGQVRFLAPFRERIE
jgi:hypothetical protein